MKIIPIIVAVFFCYINIATVKAADPEMIFTYLPPIGQNGYAEGKVVWDNPPQSPVANIRPGLVVAGTEITLSCQEESDIFYTLDGTNPITSSTTQLYDNNVFIVPESGTLFIKAVAKISDKYSSISTLTWLAQEPLTTPFWGLNVSLALNGEAFGYQLSETATRERMLPIATLTQWIRTFGTIKNGQEYINKIAKDLGLRTMIGVYITQDESNNNAQIEGLRQILQTVPPPDLIAIGNETYLLGVTPATLALNIDAVREIVLEQGLVTPIGSVDIASVSWSQSILEKLDFIGVNIYNGTWDNITEDKMADALKQTYSNLLSAFPSKLILLTETGTPYNGGEYSVPDGTQTPSEEKAVNYLCEFLDWIQQEHIPAFYFEAYDEPIKSMNGGHPIEQYFGLMNGSMQIHSFYCNCIFNTPCDSTSIPSYSTSIITLCPNPTNGALRITSNELQMANYSIYNVMGQMVLQGKLDETAVIDVASLPSGIYCLNILGNRAKFVKE